MVDPGPVQVTVQAGSQWTSRETHATGRYRADYERNGAERLRRSKRGYEAGPADDPTRAIERSMINFANLALKAVRIYADQANLDRAREKGTGPDVLDVVSPVLVG